MFDPHNIDFDTLRHRAYNHRWATVAKDVIPLTAADPDFKVAPPIIEAIQDYVGHGHLNYGPAQGLPEFQTAVAAYYSAKRAVPTARENVLALDSAAYGIYLTCKAILKPGDEAIIFNPVDFLFAYGIEAAGAKPVRLATPPGLKTLDIESLKLLVNDKTRLICLCNPLNPTGKVFTEDELMSIAELAQARDILILSDEIWSDIIFKPHTYCSIASLNTEVRKRTITITGFSKSYGLAGLRIGALMAHDQDLFQSIFTQSQHESTVHGANTVGQIAAIAALTRAQDWLEGFMEHLHNMRSFVVSGLNDVPGFSCHEPEGCYLAFPNIEKTGFSSQELQEYLLKEAKVLLVPGIPFWFGDGAVGHMRISFATSHEVLEKALDRIEKAMRKSH